VSVVIHNKLGQKLDVPVLDAGGRPCTVVVAPRGDSQPLAPERVSKHTRTLEKQGYVRIREVK
jgi:hypothetical protein